MVKHKLKYLIKIQCCHLVFKSYFQVRLLLRDRKLKISYHVQFTMGSWWDTDLIRSTVLSSSKFPKWSSISGSPEVCCGSRVPCLSRVTCLYSLLLPEISSSLFNSLLIISQLVVRLCRNNTIVHLTEALLSFKIYNDRVSSWSIALSLELIMVLAH